MKRNEYMRGRIGARYGVWNSVRKQFQFGICEETPMLAEARLFQAIGEDARKFRNGGCPYKQSGGACLNVAIRDALALLKAQEPRVMTLEEACSADCVWYDWRTIGVRPAKVSRVPYKTGTYRVQRFGDIDEWNHADEYGEYWRCWTSRPTDEQREATVWN